MAIIKMRAEDMDAITLRDALLLRGGLVNTYDRQLYVSIEMITLKYVCLLFFFLANKQAWSNRAQQILVPAWQQVTSVPPPPTTSDTVVGSQRLVDWG